MTDRRRAFLVVDEFEQALCEFTGAPYAVAVDSCTNAIFLALEWAFWKRGAWLEVSVPKHTYVGVVQAIRKSLLGIKFTDEEWSGSYKLPPTRIVDSAKRFERGMYEEGTHTCVSFQAGKLLPIGRGGAILLDDEDAAVWLRRARLDGRTEGADYERAIFQETGSHMYMPPDAAARGLWLLTYIEDADTGTWQEYPDLSEATWT